MPNNQNAQCVPRAASNGSKPSVTQKPSNQQLPATMADPFDLISGENISPITAHGKGPNPKQ